MKYQTIVYERSIKKYDDTQTAKVELIVEEGEDPHTVMQIAQGFVNSELGLKADKLEKTIQSLESKKHSLESDIRLLETNVSNARSRWEKIKEFFDKHGIEVEGDIPF